MVTVQRSYLQDMLVLSQAAYDSRLMPQGYEPLRRIVADPTHGCALLNGEALDFGFYTQKAGMGYLVFRGTQNVEEWADDACSVLVDHCYQGHVHKGFRDVLWSLLPAITATVGCDLPLTIIGHSLGAALATVAVSVLSAPEAHLVTFAGPRVGDGKFATMVESSTATQIRVVNSRDIVTHIPPRPLYSHAGGTVTFHGDSLNWKTAHSEELSYGPGLAALPETITLEDNHR